jgi:LysR family glycine cleavage system transcriptional activator
MDTRDNRKAIPPFSALRSFEAVGRLKGIRRAAEALMVDHAIVSRQVRSLEEWTGAQLLDREAGPGKLTPDGIAYQERLTAVFAELADATSELMRANDSLTLRVWCVPGLASRWLVPQLASFRRSFPDYDVILRPSDTAPDFAADEVDVDIRYVRGDDLPSHPHLRFSELARPEIFPVASPALVDADKLDAIALLDQALLHEENDSEWKTWFAAQGVAAPDRTNGVRLWHAHMCIDAARRGEGIALANRLLVDADMKEGNLVRLTGAGTPFGSPVLGAYVVATRSVRWAAPPVANFRRWLDRAVARKSGSS